MKDPRPAAGSRRVEDPVEAIDDVTGCQLPPAAARMAAIEVLLADPAALGDDTLESGLYILRERLRAAE